MPQFKLIDQNFPRMKVFVIAFQIIQHFGFSWSLFRIRWWLSKRLGFIERRSKTSKWNDVGSDSSTLLKWPPLVDKANIGNTSVTIAQKILQNKFLLFSHHEVNLGASPNWRIPGFDPDTGLKYKKNKIVVDQQKSDHWSKFSDMGSTDIKLIWEINRFAWAYALARAFVKTKEEKYARKFWFLFEDWIKENPPNCGVNWFCGQEISIRLFAVTFAVHTFKNCKSTTTLRLKMWSAFLKATGTRINAHLDYGLSQANNHGITECVGLITTSILMAGGTESNKWYQRGIQNLERQLGQLIYLDGSFAQHSANYHRLMLDDLCWLASLLKTSNKKLPDWLMFRGRIATEFLADLLDPETGRVPLYGSNDGANILPLSDCPYLDFRPTVQTASIIFSGQRWLGVGPWDEASSWLWENDQSSAKVSKREWLPNRHWKNSGSSQITTSDTRVFFKTPTLFCHRPSQADMLHVSLDWKSQPIAVDSGSFSYNHQGKFCKSLKLAKVHNTLTFADQEPLKAVSRFLLLPWPKGKVTTGFPHYLEATHNAWKRIKTRHERRVKVTNSGNILVTDITHSPCRQKGRMHWLFEDYPYELDLSQRFLKLNTPKGEFYIAFRIPVGAAISIVRGDEHSDRGWLSEYYSEVRPALSLTADFEFENTCQLETEFIGNS